MKRKPPQVIELESELLRLTELVRARRKQLNRLEKCPNKDCECRKVWREVTEDNLSKQVKKVRTGVTKPTKNGTPVKARAARP